jgi:translocation and assembly module TamB
MPRILALALAGLALLIAMPLIAQDQMSPEEQRDWFVQFVEGQLSTPDRQIRISNIDGALSSQASIREVTISDQEGVWLRIKNAAIDWDQGALFTGRLLVRELKAEHIEYVRNAVPSGDVDLPAPEAAPLAVPEFPVAIQLDKLSVPSVTFGESVFGLGSEISIDGKLLLEGGSLTTSLAIDRLDGPGGRLALDVGFNNADDTVNVAVTLTEPPNGILANLFNIEGKPEIALSVTGAGPVNDLRTTLALDAGGRRALEGAATIAQAEGGLSVNADLGGPIASLMAPPYRPFFGERTTLRTNALVRSAGGFDLSAISLSGGQLSLEGSAATTSDGFLSRLALEAVVADPGGARVTLPVPGAGTSIETARLAIDYGGAGSEDWTANIAARGFSNGDLAARDVTMTASGVAANLADPATRRLTFNADGTIAGIESDDADIQAALGDSAGFGLAGLWNAGEPIQLAELRLVGKALTMALAGTIRDYAFDGTVDIETRSVAPFSGLAGRRLGGAMALNATGTVTPLSGGFDLALDGSAENLRVSEAALDRVLAGTVQLSGRVARTAEGLTAEGFRLGNDKVELRADGSFATGAADFAFAANLADLALVSPDASGRVEITGSAKGEGTIALAFEARAPQGRLAGKTLGNAAFGFTGTLADTGALAGALRGDAMLDGLRVTLTGDVATDAETRRLTGLRFEAGPTLLTGDVVQDADGLLTGQLQLASPNVTTAAALAMIEATGSANAAIALSAANGQQSAEITGRIENLRAEDVRIGSAEIAATLRDLFGTPAVDGTVAARDVTAGGFTVDRLDAKASQSGETTSFTVDAAMVTDRALANAGITPLRASASGRLTGRVVTLDSLAASGRGGLEITGSGRVPLDGDGLAIDLNGSAPLALGNRFVADRGGQLSGTANLRARVTGPVAEPQFSGTVSIGGAGYVDPELNLRLVDIGGSATLSGQRIVVDTLSGRLSTGGTVSIAGSVALTRSNDADLSLRLDSARYADGSLFVATASGDLSLTGPLAGSSLLAGNVVIEKADITVPESLGGAAALVDAEHRNTPAPVAATLARAKVDQSGKPARSGPPSDVRLDVTVSAPNQIFVRGRGLDAEVGGSVRLTGSINDIRPVGGFNLNRGRLAILGQRVTFEEGSVTLVGDLDPFLDFRARTEGEGIAVFVDVTGRVSDLDIGFSSNPQLPEDEVLSRLLFKRSMGELTPLQLAKLAGAAAELAGGSNTSLVDSLRAKAGLADLDLVTGDDGNLAVQAGTYLQDNVYLGVQAGADGKSRVTVNLDLTDDIKAKAAAGTDGETSVGVFYEKDY